MTQIDDWLNLERWEVFLKEGSGGRLSQKILETSITIFTYEYNDMNIIYFTLDFHSRVTRTLV